MYASRSEVCTADGATLSDWNPTAFSGSGSQTSSVSPRADSQITSVRKEDSQVTSVRKEDSQVTSVEPAEPSQNTSVEEDHTQVELAAPRVSASSARGKHQIASEVGEHTDVIDTKAHETLTDFSASGDLNSNVGQLVCYDNEVAAGPFEGMLISNRYRLEEQIGTGAFGVVFDAFDKQTEKRVAIKLLSPALCDDKRALARFRREAIAASRIQHPGIVEIHDFGIQDEGVSYIVMEYLAGRDLATLLEQEPYIAPQRAANIIQQCAQALASAHDAGVLHRDLKPANIFLIQNPDRSERIKILDFGIAKDRSSNPRTADLTSASKVVGTPYYMAPEQAQGQALDPRADIYSLGVILYELLTGSRPFEGASVYEILLAHVSADRVPPSRLRPELSSEKELGYIVLKAISAKSSKRYSSMQDFSAALREYQRISAARAHNHGPHLSLHDVTVPTTVAGATFPSSPARRVTRRKSSLILWAAIPIALAASAFAYVRVSANSPDADTSTSNSPSESSPSQDVISEVPPTPTKPVAAVAEAPAEPIQPEPDAEASPANTSPAPKSKSSSGKRRRSGSKNSSKKRRPKGIEEW